MADLSFSRRSVVVGAPAAAAALLAPAVATAATCDIAPAEPIGDLRFWQAHAEWKAIRTAWDSDKDEDDDAVWDRYGERDQAALVALLLIPVRTAMALMAKYQATCGEYIRLPYPAENSYQMMEWDIGRLVMKELAA